ncbi:tRNA (guanine(37)-N1)-methyltransferase 2 isoform X1 [Iris pallida]|uniref:tRNA (Guanine(37)-N1)-methyltransferase 2 isoform X1 n=1 Tax=Iris pallida TaxID=29817 RepID=A0AAX6HV54_IRIPA|nr:tRNA (guanine(37)-N1)-methyltransferase 2 isoform X1 [Iris pallida]
MGPDVDLLMDRIDVERRIGNWIRALDRHVAGACRADERLKPLLKLDISSGVAKARFMAQPGHLGNQFFLLLEMQQPYYLHFGLSDKWKESQHEYSSCKPPSTCRTYLEHI